ncbi:MAG: class I SAM-dependent methyltransferase [Ruminococcus sp.]|nr:class I SAM-dependent methyltransferase [Ruminococcus sp.]
MAETNGYSAFARFYDQLTDNVDYSARAARLDMLIQRYAQTEGKVLLDLACGTGNISEAMARLGYDVLGVDNSPEMLGCALDKKFDSGLPIQYVCQDIRNLDMYGTFDVTLCILDSLNHLDGLSDIQAVFSRVSECSEPDALFIFDMNTLYKHESVLGNNVFVYETDAVYCVWSNEYTAPDVEITLDFFEKHFDGEGEVYHRSTEQFTERAYPVEEIDRALEEAGFTLITHLDGEGEGDAPVRPDSERILFIARKKEN